jgi:serine/threonine protein kinase/Flp pilus assembly protein TadD
MFKQILNNRYKIIREIGRGGFGITYLAEDRTNTNSLCVVKQLNPYHAEISTAKRLFQREADTLKELKEADQIPNFIEYFEEDRNSYIVQEYIQGKTLDKLINENWDSENLSRFLWDVLSVLEKLHKNNIIHRDIKPSNLIKSDLNSKIVVIDFGAVKQLNIAQNKINSSQENLVFNTPTATKVATAEYAPREQKRGKPLLNSDIYALGMTALQLVTKISPINLIRDDKDNIILDRIPNNMDTPLLAILNEMVKNDPKERYQSASSVLKAIDSRTQEPPTQIIFPRPQKLFTVNAQNSEQTESFPTIVKSQKLDKTEPFPTIVKSQKLDKTEPFPTIVKSQKLDKTEPFPTIVKSQKLDKTEPFPTIVKSQKLDKTEPFPTIVKPQKLDKTEPFPTTVHPQTDSQNIDRVSTKSFFSKVKIKKNIETATIHNHKNLDRDNNYNNDNSRLDSTPNLLSTNQKIKPFLIFLPLIGLIIVVSEFIFPRIRPAYFIYQGNRLLEQKKAEESLAQFYQVTSLKENSFDGWKGQGDALLSLGKVSGALEAYDKALNFKPNDIQKLNNLGEFLLEQANNLIFLQQPEDALSLLKKAAEIRPKDERIWYTQGTVLEQILKRHQEALNVLNKATELNPQFAPAWLSKGLSLISLKRYEDALKSLERAKDLEPQNPYIWQNRGLVLQHLGRQSESSESYQKAKELGVANVK